MNAMRPWRPALWLLPTLVFAVAVWQVRTTPLLPPAGAGDAAARARVAQAVRAAEPGFRRETFEHFPADPWSRGDDFAANERNLVEHLAGKEQMRIGAVLEVIDRDVKFAKDETRDLPDRGRVAPCVPRPFYD